MVMLVNSQTKLEPTMNKIIAAVVFIAVTAVPAAASDKGRPSQDARPETACSAKPAAEWMPIEQITAKLKEQGFTVLKIEAKRAGCYEAKVTDAKGAAIELHLDAATAEIVRRHERS